MDIHHEKIQAWLSSIYKDEPIPQYEINERTSNLLYALSRQSFHVESCTTKIADDLKQKSSEISLEKDRITGLLKRIGLDPFEMSSKAQHSMRTIASAALALDLQDTSMTKFVLGINQLKMDEIKADSQLLQEQNITKGLLRKTNGAVQELSLLKQNLNKVEGNVASQEKEMNTKLQNGKYLKQKIQGYEKELKYLNKLLLQSGLTQGSTHENLIKLSNDVDILAKKHESHNVKLETYRILPADKHLAKLKLMEAKAQLEKLDLELFDHLKQASISH